MMEWKDIYLDATLVPLGVAILLAYHAFLLWKVRSNPLQTVIGVNHLARRLWVYSIVKVKLLLFPFATAFHSIQSGNISRKKTQSKLVNAHLCY